MQNKIFNTLLGAGIAAIIGGAITLTPAISQTVAATLVRNVDEPGRNPYQEQKFGSGLMAFSAVPTGKRLVITHVSGATGYGVATEADPLVIENEGNGTVKINIPTQQYVPTLAQQNGKSYVAGSDIKMYFEAGEYPRAAFTVFPGSPANYTAFITLSGYYIDLP